MKRYRLVALALILILANATVTGCGNTSSQADNLGSKTEESENMQNVAASEGVDSVDILEAETAVDSHIDFGALQTVNDDIFGWLQVPGTDIDCPILQSKESDDYYKSHNAKKESDGLGSAYIEMPVMNNMCDFNTVIHGSSDGVYQELINFENPDFFDKNQKIYVYLPNNQLTYDIWAVFERENNSLIREFSFAEAKGDREFLDYVYNERIVGKQIREGWEELDEYNFLITLSMEMSNDKQLVVIGALTADAAGSINRDVIEEFDLGPDLMAQ